MNWMENCSFVGHYIFMKMWWKCVHVFDTCFLAHFIWKFPPPKINSEGSVLVTVMSSVLVYLGLIGCYSLRLCCVVAMNRIIKARKTSSPQETAKQRSSRHELVVQFYWNEVIMSLLDLIFFLIISNISKCLAFCPYNCICDNERLETSCVETDLDVS